LAFLASLLEPHHVFFSSSYKQILPPPVNIFTNTPVHDYEHFVPQFIRSVHIVFDYTLHRYMITSLSVVELAT